MSMSLCIEVRMIHEPHSYEGSFCSPSRGKAGMGQSSLGWDHVSRVKVDICPYCRGKGHWKSECPVLKRKSGGQEKGVGLVSLVVPVVDSLPGQASSNVYIFSPFITTGFVSLAEKEERVPVRILRDTGAHDTFISETLLPYSKETKTGFKILVQGIGL